jgi:hypothetical protein
MRDTKSDNLSRELSAFIVLKQTCLTIHEYIIIIKTIIKEEGSQEKRRRFRRFSLMPQSINRIKPACADAPFTADIPLDKAPPLFYADLYVFSEVT